MPKSVTASTHSFAEVPRAEMPRSSFDRSHAYKTTFDIGRLVPFYVDEAVPGDTFNLRTSGYCRLSTPIFPIMDNLYMDTHYFAVPNRLLWDNWERFMGEIPNPQVEQPGEVTFLIPQAQLGSVVLEPQDIGDYFGLPINKPNLEGSALFSRAYRLIWNEWFRDQNLQDPLPFNTGDGPDIADSIQTKTAVRGKRHDYFTSALPWPQKGPDVTIGLSGFAQVQPINQQTQAPTFDWYPGFDSGDGPLAVKGGTSSEVIQTSSTLSPGQNTLYWDDPGLQVDLSTGSAVTINALREAFQIQKLYERDARGGTRYVELIKAHFGVTSPDARMQRPEFLGGGTAMVNISPLVASADTATDTQSGRELGALSAVGTVNFNGHGFTKSFTEHCIIIGLVSVRADQTYQQGIDRMFSRKEKLDFYWPALSHLGEQEILNKEIFYSNDDNLDNGVFGYQERYGEMRYYNSRITGKFRSDAVDSLDAWHVSEDFDTLPTLSEAFIRHLPPLDRCLAYPDEPNFIGDFWHDLKCARPMPMYGQPGNVDRF